MPLAHVGVGFAQRAQPAGLAPEPQCAASAEAQARHAPTEAQYVPAPQSASPAHCEQTPFEHTGVVSLQLKHSDCVRAVPQRLGSLDEQPWHWPVSVLQNCPVTHEPGRQRHAPSEQSGVGKAHAAHVVEAVPQWRTSVAEHAAHAPFAQ